MAEVFSHLGSGAEISRSTLLDSLGDVTANAPATRRSGTAGTRMSPAEQAAAFVEHDGVLVDLYESLTPEQRATTQVELGFLPAPVSLAVPLAMRLSEQTLHGWDARVGVDADAALSDDAADLLAASPRPVDALPARLRRQGRQARRAGPAGGRRPHARRSTTP